MLKKLCSLLLLAALLLCAAAAEGYDVVYSASNPIPEIAARVRPDTLTSEGHWVLVVGVNENGSVTVYDPTSSEVTGHEWAPGTIADAGGGLYALAAGAE